ncbi:hypothetical protein E2C01_039125 [Portunus trituberculatus]|uniref:Uncharacterized protein n=1 Tax=Portunus trituberculatus TaxID=210409 RepID=A0A5B7FIT4_PORTR|nr:hypothetical protein [Portunus trituberculatus]
MFSIGRGRGGADWAQESRRCLSLCSASLTLCPGAALPHRAAVDRLLAILAITARTPVSPFRQSWAGEFLGFRLAFASASATFTTITSATTTITITATTTTITITARTTTSTTTTVSSHKRKDILS